MRKHNLFAALTLLIFGTVMMQAQASRTWVSGVGDDANPCSRTAPCKTFAGAISKTAAGGEIDALDPAGYGAVTITKAITIDGGGGQVASVLVSGTNGIVVQANATTDVVILRNLRINGIGSGLNGIRFLSGKDLNVENCYIFGFTQNGVDIALNQATQASVHVLNSVLKNNGGVGIKATNAVLPAVKVVVSHTATILDNIGVEAAQHSKVVFSNSVCSQATTDCLRADDTPTGDAQMNVSNSDITTSANGVATLAGGTINIAFNNIAFNTSCAVSVAGGTSIFSFGNNRLSGGPGVCGALTPVGQQ